MQLRGWRRAATAAVTALVGAAGLTVLAPVRPVEGAVAPSTPVTWGGNGFGQLGDGSTTARRSAGPVAGLSGVVDLHGGREHVAALTQDGHVYTWGSNVEGQLGTGTTGNQSRPTLVSPAQVHDITAVETGHNHTVALRSDGTVWTWGLNTDGQLGDGSTTLRRSPVQVAGLSDAVAVAAGRNMTYAVRADGTLVGWGRNEEGQLGDGTTTQRRSPVRVGTLTDVVDVAGGRDHGVALRSDGTVWAWGENSYGQVGDGTTSARVTAPVQVTSGGTPLLARQVIAGAHHTFALRTDGRVAAWGRNYRSNLGDGTTTTPRTRPVDVLDQTGPLTGVVSIGSGRDHGLAVLADGTVKAWGHNASGQLGDGTLSSRSRAVTVPGITDAVLAGGGGAEYSVVLTRDEAPAPQDPVAAFTSTCTGLSCTFDASTSTDDGTLTSYAWSFGDGATGSGQTATHTFGSSGTWTVGLVVTDDSQAQDSVTRQVQVSAEPPPGESVTFRAAAASDASTARPSVVVPGTAQPGDRLVLVVTANRAATTAAPAGWTQLGTVSDGTEVRSWVFTRAAVTGTAGSTVRLALDATAKVALTLLAYDGAGPVSVLASRAESSTTASHLAPPVAVAAPGSTVVSYWADKSSTAHTWSLPTSVVRRSGTTGSGGGLLTTVVGDTAEVPTGSWPGATAVAELSSNKAVSWSLVLQPL